MTSATTFTVILVAGTASCASTGIAPQDMTAAEHESAASREDATAGEHRQRHERNASERVRCPAYASGDCAPYWSSTIHPTDQHARDAVRHRELAAKHRAASQALRDAEARSCAGLPAAERDISLFYHREDIDRVEPITRAAPITTELLGVGPGGPIGARVVFRAQPGLTTEWLQRVVDCHLARLAVTGSDDPQLAYCPLAFARVTATVKPVRGGFAVEILAPDESTARALTARARALKGGAQ